MYLFSTFILSICLWREPHGIIACCNPVPPLVRQYLFDLHGFVREARDPTSTAASTFSSQTSLPSSASRQASVQAPSTPSTPRPAPGPTSFSGSSLSALDNAYYASLLEADPSLLHLLTPTRPPNPLACPHERPVPTRATARIESESSTCEMDISGQQISFTCTGRCSLFTPLQTNVIDESDDFNERRARWQRINDSFQNPLKKVCPTVSKIFLSYYR